MADSVTARDESSSFAPHPEGSFPSVVVDVVDMGLRLETFQGRAPRAVPKVALVFATGEVNETKQLHIVSREFTNSLYETAALRGFLGDLRGKALSEQQARAGIDLGKLVGVAALIVVEHRESKKGRTYAVLSNVMVLPKGMKPPVLPAPYVRGEFWAERKKAYADELAAVAQSAKAASAATGAGGNNFSDYPAAVEEEDDDLPF